MNKTPIYQYSSVYAREHDELKKYLASHNAHQKFPFIFFHIAKKRHDTVPIFQGVWYHASSFCRRSSPAMSHFVGTWFTLINTLFASSSLPIGQKLYIKSTGLGKLFP